MAAGEVEVTDEWRADLTDLIKPRSGQCRYQAGSCEQNDVPWRLQSAPISAENVVTIGTQIRRINPQGAPRLQDAAYFVQASDWIVQMFDGMTHGHRSEAGIGVNGLWQAPHRNRQTLRPANRRRVRVRVQSFGIPAASACRPDKGSVTTADIQKTCPPIIETQVPSHQIPFELYEWYSFHCPSAARDGRSKVKVILSIEVAIV
jgi:hypothetical protein